MDLQPHAGPPALTPSWRAGSVKVPARGGGVRRRRFRTECKGRTLRENPSVGAFRRRSPRAELAAELDRVLGLFPLLRERTTQLAGTRLDARLGLTLRNCPKRLPAG